MNIAFLLELHKAVGSAITVEQQLWISGRYTTLTAFLALQKAGLLRLISQYFKET